MFKSPFTASKLQVATYLLGVALFSISFLVFLNSAVSFVISDLIGQKKGIGNASGTLGFADELLSLVACPLWGMISDRLSTKNVVALGYCITGVSLFVFVQAQNVYPGLLLGRLFFALGGAAIATMVTAILPTMTANKTSSSTQNTQHPDAANRTSGDINASTSSEPPVTPSIFRSQQPASRQIQRSRTSAKPAPSQISGLVGMFTGLGALVALGLLLPLPAWFRKRGYSPGDAVQASFYIAGSIALVVSLFCLLGLRNLPGEHNKGWARFFRSFSLKSKKSVSPTQDNNPSFVYVFSKAVGLGFTDIPIGLGYLGGFVARASSVGLSLFVPLYINAYFIASGLCNDDPDRDPERARKNCRRAYTLAAALTGSSQVFALIGAPIFGWVDGRYRRFNLPILFASLCGVAGYTAFARLKSPDPKDKDGGPGIYVIMMLMGLSQIGAIVCSLSSLSRGIDAGEDDDCGVEDAHASLTATENFEDTHDRPEDDGNNERSHLLPAHLQRPHARKSSRSHLKGSISGVYSLVGGAGIILLTKLGGFLFDKLSTGAPFYMLAMFNGALFVAALGCGIGTEIQQRRNRIAL